MTSHPATLIEPAKDAAAFSARDFRNAMGAFASGVVVINLFSGSGPH